MSEVRLRKYSGFNADDGAPFWVKHRKAEANDGTWYRSVCSCTYISGDRSRQADKSVKDADGKMALVVPTEATAMEEHSWDQSRLDIPAKITYYTRRSGGHWIPQVANPHSFANTSASPSGDFANNQGDCWDDLSETSSIISDDNQALSGQEAPIITPVKSIASNETAASMPNPTDVSIEQVIEDKWPMIDGPLPGELRTQAPSDSPWHGRWFNLRSAKSSCN